MENNDKLVMRAMEECSRVEDRGGGSYEMVAKEKARKIRYARCARLGPGCCPLIGAIFGDARLTSCRYVAKDTHREQPFSVVVAIVDTKDPRG